MALDNSKQTYHEYLRTMAAKAEATPGPWFRVHNRDDLLGLWRIFILSIDDPIVRASYMCDSCKYFVDTYGDIVSVNADGSLTSVMWDSTHAPPEIALGIERMRRKVEACRIESPYYADVSVLGRPETQGGSRSHPTVPYWRHFHALGPKDVVAGEKTATEIGRVRGNYEQVKRAMGEYTVEQLELAVQVLQSNALYRADKTLAAGEWLLAMRRIHAIERDNHLMQNLFWQRVALAPDGFCHPRSSMISTLLEDLQKGLPFADVKAKFDAKMNPGIYMRPTAAPAEGAILAANKAFAELGLESSLLRRYARFEELKLVWRPIERPVKKSDGGAFSGLLSPANTTSRDAMPVQNITAVKFLATVLPAADTIEYRTAGINDREPYTVYVTAEVPDSKPLLRWDRDEQRNQVSTYVHVNGSTCRMFNLPHSTFIKCLGIASRPECWHGLEPSKGLTFILEGCRESVTSTGLALFPEIIRSDLHGYNRVIEAFSERTAISGLAESTACGIGIGAQSRLPVGVFRVTSGKLVQLFKFDRWD